MEPQQPNLKELKTKNSKKGKRADQNRKFNYILEEFANAYERLKRKTL